MPELSLSEQLIKDQQEATRAKDRFRLSVIRLLRAELQNSVIAKKGPLDPEEELTILSREVKRRQEALGDYERSQRQDLLEDLKKEIAILQAYLPAQLSETELEKLVHEAVDLSGAKTRQELGKVMGLLMPRIKGKADGGLVRQMVEKFLQ